MNIANQRIRRGTNDKTGEREGREKRREKRS